MGDVMQLYGMDKELIEIYNLHNIESIKLWDLVQNGTGKMVVIPTLLVTYDGGKYLNIGATDKNFRVFVQKVVEVYHNEKDNLLEDGLTDPFRLRPRINIDEKTKEILLSGHLEEINEIYSFYDGKDCYDSSLLFQIDEVKALLPMIKYHIKNFYGFTDRVVTFDEGISGYRDNYMISGQVDGIEVNITLLFNKVDTDEYEVYVGGLNDKHEPLGIKIKFSKDAISVDLIIPSYNLVSSYLYHMTKGAPKVTHEIKKNGLPVVFEDKDLANTDNEWENVADLDYDSSLSWYRLPWNALYGVDNEIQEISETEKIVKIHNMFIEATDNQFVRREYYAKTYVRNRTVAVDAKEMVLDEVRKTVNGVNLSLTDGIYVIETNFTDKVLGHSGYYDEKLKNRYFYHLCQSSKGIKGIDRASLKQVSKDDNVLQASDMLNKARMLKLVKGE